MEIKSLGLAAYIKMRGGRLKEVTDAGNYIFEDSDRDERAWEIEYINSCCYRHDRELMTLRSMRK